MTETVTSEFKSFLWTIKIFVAILNCGLIALLVLAININIHLTPTYIILGALCLTVYGYFYIKKTINTFIKITVAPEYLIFNYLLIKKKITIYYANIVHVESVDLTTYGRDGTKYISATKLNIDLNTGKRISFSEDSYSNYDELKESIRKHRFNLE